jgi:hypothetical protein
MAKPPFSPAHAPRRSTGFKAASALLGPHIRKAGEARGFAVTRLLTHWAEIAGPEIAACARPVKVGYGKRLGATLTLLTTGPAAPMVQMQLPALREKINACYGYNAIARITLTQTAPTGFAEGQAEFAPAPKTREKAPDATTVATAKARTQDIADDGLRLALERLATHVIDRQARTRGKHR